MELRIDSYINQLLFHHNCVIIPSFGGFVGNYKGAEIHPTQHIFSAPSKQLVFNKNLVTNDGLLANFIVQEDHITYQEALDIIDKDVFRIKHLLLSGEKVMLQSIGFLKLDVEKNIQFSPSASVNYSPASFGLHGFQSSAIKRGGFVTQVEKTFKDRPAIKAKSGFRKYKKFALPILALPLAVMLFLSPFTTTIKDKINTSGFFGSTTTLKLYQPEDHKFNLELAEIVTMKIWQESADIEIAEDAATEFAVAEITKVSEVLVQPISVDRAYTLISGCFAVKENAEKQVEQLKLKNIEATIVGQTKTGLYRVGCGNFNSANEAAHAMLKFKEQQTEVWVLKN